MLTAVILAAGKGTRMRSDGPKVLFEAAGRPMLDYVLDAARGCGADKIIVVAGNGADRVMNHAEAGDVVFCVQHEQKGTADAVKAALPHIPDRGRVLILCGDMPLITLETLSDFIARSDSRVNFISVKTGEPAGYGRVVRTPAGGVLKIVEEKDANGNEKKINEINAGVYLCEASELKERLDKIGNNNAQKEYYLTDIVTGGGAFAYCAENGDEFIGVNDRKQLAAVSKILWRGRAEKFMKEGVSVLDPDTFYCDADVKIGMDTVIYPGVFLEKGTCVGRRCKIRSGSRISASLIEDGCEIKDNTLIEGSTVGESSSVGPMAHLRPGSVLTGNNKIGNFVETKKTVMGYGSKASHLTYLGDAELGRDVNVGCGTITCNYDGFNKHRTVVGDNVFIGSDVQLVAPVNVGDGALVAAGTTVTKDVPPDALAIARAPQVNKEGMGKAVTERNKAGKI